MATVLKCDVCMELESKDNAIGYVSGSFESRHYVVRGPIVKQSQNEHLELHVPIPFAHLGKHVCFDCREKVIAANFMACVEMLRAYQPKRVPGFDQGQIIDAEEVPDRLSPAEQRAFTALARKMLKA